LPLSNKAVKTKSQIASSIKIPPIIIWSLMLIISATSIFLNRKWIFPVFSPYFSSSSGTADHDIAPVKHTPAPTSQPSLANSKIAPDHPMIIANGSPLSSPLQESQATTNIQPAIPETDPLPVSKSIAPAFLLEIIGKEKCWISINSDGSSVFSRTVQPGEIQSFNAEQKLFLIVGNAGGISIKINGKPAKPLGKPGEVIKVLINETTLPDLIDRSTG
jgi:hypothetical protein